MEFLKGQTLHTGKWIQHNFLPPSTEFLTRLTKKSFKNSVPYDSITILPILHSKEGKKKVILASQFRPSVNAFVLEFPGGLAETEDSAIEAERELEEETGYKTNGFFYESKPLWGDPDFSNVSDILVVGKIQDHENEQPKQKLEEDENIRVHVLDFDEDLLENVEKLAKEHNYVILDRVRFVGMGLKNQI